MMEARDYHTFEGDRRKKDVRIIIYSNRRYFFILLGEFFEFFPLFK